MNKSTKKIICLSALIAVVIGLFMGVYAMYGAWIYNVGEDIHSNGVIHWGYWFIVGIFWFIPTSIMSFILGLLIAGIFKLYSRLKNRRGVHNNKQDSGTFW